MKQNILNLVNKTEKDVEIIFNFLEPKKIYNEIILLAEELTFQNFNKNNSDFFIYENLEYFEEKRKFANMYLIEKDSLLEIIETKLKRKAFDIEKYYLITCDKELRIIN